MPNTSKNYQKPSHAEIAAYAYSIYEFEGQPEGKAMQHWLEAEAQLIAERQAQAGQLPFLASAKSANGDGQASRKQSRLWSPPAHSQQKVHAR